MIFHAFLIKYAEIAIKGKNRYLFEDALVKQMKLALEPVEGEFTVTKEQGRVYVFCPEKYDFDEYNFVKVLLELLPCQAYQDLRLLSLAHHRVIVYTVQSLVESLV